MVSREYGWIHAKPVIIVTRYRYVRYALQQHVSASFVAGEIQYVYSLYSIYSCVQ